MSVKVSVKKTCIGILIGFCLAIFMEAKTDMAGKVAAAKAQLQAGVNSWDGEKLKSSRDTFLSLLMNEDAENIYLHYYVALCDYRLAAFSLSESDMEVAGRFTGDAQKHLEAIIESQPDWGEPYALYAAMLGFEIALDMSKAMTIGMKIYQYFDLAFAKEPNNPRIHFIKGSSDLYTPEQYGGGVGPAIEKLSRAVELFEKEEVKDPMKPSWGREEAMTFLGMAYQQKGDQKMAGEWYEKALAINPDFGMAREARDRMKKESD